VAIGFGRVAIDAGRLAIARAREAIDAGRLAVARTPFARRTAPGAHDPWNSA
jgi:hypothetical protein